VEFASWLGLVSRFTPVRSPQSNGMGNYSLLAHGFNPVREEIFEKMLMVALDFMGITRDELPVFPQSDIERMGCGLL